MLAELKILMLPTVGRGAFLKGLLVCPSLSILWSGPSLSILWFGPSLSILWFVRAVTQQIKQAC